MFLNPVEKRSVWFVAALIAALHVSKFQCVVFCVVAVQLFSGFLKVAAKTLMTLLGLVDLRQLF